MRVSLGVLLACGLAGLQLLAVLAVVFSSYVSSEQALITHARELLRDVGTNTIEHSKSFLNPGRGAAELAARLAQNRIVASDDPVLLEQLLFQQLQLTPQFSGLYYGGADGSFVYIMRESDGPAPLRTKIITVSEGVPSTELIWRTDNFGVVLRQDDPEDTYDPRTRPWYIQAQSDRTTIWTDPYIFFSSRQPGITLAAPVFTPDGSIRGVVGVDIEISAISDFLSRLQIGESGRALIINRNGDVIAHPQLDLIRTQNEDGTLSFVNIRDLGDPVARAAFGHLVQEGDILIDQETPSQFTYDGESFVSNLMPVDREYLPWTIAVYAPENDFTAEIKRNRMANLWIAVLVAAITGGVGLMLAEYIHRPVRAFAVRSALIAQGEIDPSAQAPRTYRELEKANTALVQQILARREAESEYGQTFDLSSRGMAQISPVDGSVIRANARFGEIVGAPPERVIGGRLSDVAHPEEDLSKYVFGSELVGNQEMRWVRPDGEVIWVRLNMLTIHGEKGQPLHGVLTVDDITQERARAAQISQLSRDLAHLARGDTMGQMAAGLAHELNQPLTAIAQNADSALLTLDAIPDADPELREILSEIERQSLRAGDIIRALRGFIRKDEGSRTVFDLSDLMEQTRRLVQAEAVEAGVKVRIDLGELPRVQANRIQIAQVIVNLLRNAIEAMADSCPEMRRITVRARDRHDMVEVSIEDSGPGVDPGVNLFSQFETTKPDGMGLGLSICRALIEANGGSLRHEAVLRPGTDRPCGARFSFTLPADGAA